MHDRRLSFSVLYLRCRFVFVPPQFCTKNWGEPPIFLVIYLLGILYYIPFSTIRYESMGYGSTFTSLLKSDHASPPASQLLLTSSLNCFAFSRLTLPSIPRLSVNISKASFRTASAVPVGLLSPRRRIGRRPGPLRTSKSSYPILWIYDIAAAFDGWSLMNGQHILNVLAKRSVRVWLNMTRHEQWYSCSYGLHNRIMAAMRQKPPACLKRYQHRTKQQEFTYFML